MKQFITDFLVPTSSDNYRAAAAIFCLLAILIIGVSSLGFIAIAGVANWQPNAMIYLCIIAIGVTASAGAAIYCLNRYVDGSVSKATARTVAGSISMLLGAVQMIYFSALVFAVVMHFFGYALPTPQHIHELLARV